jgi:hypothetical protein
VHKRVSKVLLDAVCQLMARQLCAELHSYMLVAMTRDRVQLPGVRDRGRALSTVCLALDLLEKMAVKAQHTAR